MAAKMERPDSTASATTGRAMSPSTPSLPSRPNTTEPQVSPRSGARAKTMAKPRSMLARLAARGNSRREQQGLKEAEAYRAGHGYGKGFGPCKPASASPCETALLSGLTEWQLPTSEAPLAEILLQNDKVELGEKYNMRISSRFQPLVAKTAHYHFPLPTSEQNRRYSNVRHKHPPEGVPSLEPPKDKKDPTSTLSKSPERQTPLLTKLRQPVQEGMARLRPGVAYSVSRLEEWFLLLDTSRSGEVTVRKLILGMMKHQEIMDLVFLLREKSEGRSWQLKPESRPTAGKLTRDDMQWVRAMLEELGAGGGASMTWPEFVDFFRQTGLLLEYSTRDELNQSDLGETNIEDFLRRQEEEFQLDQERFFSEQRRGARIFPSSPERSERRSSRSSCALAQTT
ncbi:PAT17 [Symbiodinium sp. CCMP2592]|nr:PAT17 [Symbiodinium sp. CCMP2592]